MKVSLDEETVPPFIFKFPLPEALVKVIPVEDTVPPCIVNTPEPLAFVK